MSNTQEVNLLQIGQIAVNVHDLDKAVTFYRDVLGMVFLFQVPPNIAFFNCGGIRLMLTLPEREEFDHRSSIIYYKVDEINQTYDTTIDSVRCKLVFDLDYIQRRSVLFDLYVVLRTLPALIKKRGW